MPVSVSFPAYLALLETDELERRAASAHEMLRDCVLCGRHCHVDRLGSTAGAACRTGERAVVSGHHPHHGEEDVLRGWKGSGTIFFSWCNLRCVNCQNWEISQQGVGREVDRVELAERMLDLQELGCHNVNLVSPSHVVAQVLDALVLAARRGLSIPLVWNSGGYDSQEALALLDGVVDIYMPDMKWGDSAAGRLYSRVRNYASVNRAAVKEMHRQVGDLTLDASGLARRGLLVRHLVLPGGAANTGRVLKFLAQEISKETWVNLMDQYRPAYLAAEHPPLDRSLAAVEYERALKIAGRLGLHRLDPGRRAPRWVEEEVGGSAVP